MRFFRYLLIGCASLLLLCAAAPASAAGLTSAQIAAIVNVLQSFNADAATIAEVESVLGSSSPGSTSSSGSVTQGAATSSGSYAFCSYVNDALAPGLSGAAVTALQQFLTQTGFYNGTATGYYGSLTQGAVEALQSRGDIVTSGSPQTTGYGALGPRTRAYIASTYCGGASAGASTGAPGLSVSLNGLALTLVYSSMPASTLVIAGPSGAVLSQPLTTTVSSGTIELALVPTTPNGAYTASATDASGNTYATASFTVSAGTTYANLGSGSTGGAATSSVPGLPSCSLTLSPNSLIAGGRSTLYWSTEGATSLSIDNGIGSVTPVAGGSIAVSPGQTTYYTGTASNGAGETNCYGVVYVGENLNGGGTGTGTGTGTGGGSTGSFSMTPYFSVAMSGDYHYCDPTIENEISSLFGQAAKGSSVYLSMYNWDTVRADYASECDNAAQVPDLVGAVQSATARGVSVHIIVDSTVNTAGDIAALKAAAGSPNVTICNGECGTNGQHIDHNKFLIFSALQDGTQNIAIQSSENISPGQMKLDNNMIVFKNAPQTYQNYLTYWNDLKTEAQSGTPAGNYNSTQTTDAGVVVHHFPQTSGDYLVQVLQGVDCSQGGTIRMTELRFSDSRLAVAQELAALEQAGCDVGVIVDNGVLTMDNDDDSLGDTGTYTQSLNVLLNAGVALYSSQHIHSKYFIINARYNNGSGLSSAPEQLVLEGSENLSGPSLRDDNESTVLVPDPSIYSAYLANWNQIESGRSTLVNLPTISITAPDASANNTGTSNGNYTLSRTGLTVAALPVTLSASGSAVRGVDYALLVGGATTTASTFVIPAGQSTLGILLNSLRTSFSGSLTATLGVSANSAYAVGSPGSATVTIHNAQ